MLKKVLVHVNKKGRGFRASSSDEGPIAAGGFQYDFLVSKNILHRNAAAHPILLHSDDKHNVSATQFNCKWLYLLAYVPITVVSSN